ncbi:MAG: hypothetical protein LWX07_05085 [Bacteroidetes bacterium]|nr:hypothetical protein [Bacteroidota bacterium]
MRNIKSITSVLTAVILLVLFGGKIYAQDSPILCDNYESLYQAIKDGIPASINKSTYIRDFSLIEKSLITVSPVTVPKTGYTVNYLVTDLYSSEKRLSDESSVLGFMTAGCRNFAKDYKKFINKSCVLTADTPESALDAVKSGIDFTIDMSYNITGDLVDTYKKLCASDTSTHHTVVKKPAVYLYPESNMNVSVKVFVNGHLTVTEPEYGNGWNVNVTPEGIIDGKYDYLFYEAALNKTELPDEGWVVEYSRIEKWFDETLPALGLNKKETEQFKDYWLKDLKKANYYEIRLLGNEFLENNMRLDITPAPQTILRLNFHFKPAAVKTELKAPEIKKVERKGFTVIEWGGINFNEQLTDNN